MKHEAILEGRQWLARDERVEVDFDVRVHGAKGQIDAQILNLSADGFRIQSEQPIDIGEEVTLEVPARHPVRAVICWACGLEAGGVFAESVAL